MNPHESKANKVFVYGSIAAMFVAFLLVCCCIMTIYGSKGFKQGFCEAAAESGDVLPDFCY